MYEVEEAMINTIKMVVTDVDGTVVEEGTKHINPEYFEVIRQLTNQGIQVVVASGRQYESIRSLFEPVQDLIWYIADGGAVIKVDQEFEIVNPIPKEWVEECWADIQKIEGVDGVLCAYDRSYAPDEESEMFLRMKDDYQVTMSSMNGWDNLPNQEISKMSIFRKEQIDTFTNLEFVPKWKDRLYLTIAGEWWLDCMMPGVNKGSALESIMKRSRVKRNELIVSGDNMNDLEMMKVADHAYAVATARDEVKALAKKIIPSHTEDGVLKEWKKLLV